KPVITMITSENLLNKDEFMFDRWSATGGVQVNPNYLRALVPVDADKIDLEVPVTLSGGFNVGSAPGLRFAWFDEGMDYMGGEPAPIIGVGVTGTKPAGCAFIGVNIALNSSMGSDPTNNMYTGTAMMVWGDHAKPFVPYKPGISADYIIGLV